jgi:hypothetical protein
MWFTCNDITVPWAGAKNVKRLIGLIDAALYATAQEGRGDLLSAGKGGEE